MKLFPSSRGAGGGGHSLAGEGGGPGQEVAAGGRAGGGAALAHTGRGAPLLPPQLTQQGPAHTVRSALSGAAIIPVLLAWQVSVHSSDCYVRLREAEEKYQTQTHQTEQHTGGREGSFYENFIKEHTIYREEASE